MSEAGASEAPSIGRRSAILAEEHPEATAIVFAPVDGPDREISWRELEGASNQVARLLEQHGVDATSLVAVGLRNSPEHFFVAFGAWKLGACVLPLRWDLPVWERAPLLEIAGPKVVVANWEDVDRPLLTTADLKAATALPSGPLVDRVPDPAHAIATSGATGRPKIIITPGAGLYDAQPMNVNMAEYMHTGPGQVQLIPAPLYHTNGFRIAHRSLLEDQQIVVMERFTAERAVELIERYRVNILTMVPTMLMRIARLPDLASRDLSSLAAVLQGGACCPQWLIRAWFDLVGADHFFVAYGSSEGVGLTLTRGDEWLLHPGTVGRGMVTEIRILDELGDGVPTGEVGEIFMRKTEDNGPTYEYRGAPPAKSTADGFITIGDLGWLDEDGYLYIADRRSDMIVSGGANVYPAEIEAALTEHPQVADVAVIGLPDEEWGRRVHAVVQAADPLAPPAVEELQAHCRERLTAYKAPKSYEFVEALPRTEAGKINRSALASARSTT